MASATGVDTETAVVAGMGAGFGALGASAAGDKMFAMGVAPTTGNFIAPGYNEKRSF